MGIMIQPQFTTDSTGQKVAVLSMTDYNEIMHIVELYEEREMLEDIETYKQAKAGSPDYEPFDEVLKRIQEING
ncbi:XRE family transcriptional regulator [Bergeyella porcorum]